jgi:hypothetical protein
MSLVIGLFSGALLFFTVRLGGMQQHEFNSLFFKDSSDMPDFLRSYAPLDLAMMCLCNVVALRLLMSADSSKASLPRVFLGGVGGLGCFGAIIGAGMYSWYQGVEMFLLIVLMVTALCSLTALLGTVLFFGGRPIYRLIARSWRRLRTTSLGSPFVRLGKYLTAEDVPEVTE